MFTNHLSTFYNTKRCLRNCFRFANIAGIVKKQFVNSQTHAIADLELRLLVLRFSLRTREISPISDDADWCQ